VVGDGVQAQKMRIYSLGMPNKPFRYRWNQGGDAIDNVVGDAFVKNIPGIMDWNATYKMIKNNADHQRCDSYLENDRGWIPGDIGGKSTFKYEGITHAAPIFCNVSQALEMNLNDFCVAQVAKGLGKTDDYKRYMKRSNQWTEIWNANITLREYIEKNEVKNAFGAAKNLKDQVDSTIWDCKGWFGSKTSKGEFSGPGEYHESPLTDYVFFVPHNIPKVIELMGGKEKFCERLDKTKIAAWNEPGFLALRAYYYAGRPDKAMPRIRETMKLWTEDGGVKYPGDDDSGAMSTWFIFSAIGFFPNAGTTDYFVNGPLYPEIEIKLGNGKTLKIIGKNASWDNYFVQSFKINEKIVNKTIISHQDIMNGGVFEFVMGNKPSKWGVK
jgi:putative alpha-1,2-mannosidase